MKLTERRLVFRAFFSGKDFGVRKAAAPQFAGSSPGKRLDAGKNALEKN